jgi:hypothetical protein
MSPIYLIPLTPLRMAILFGWQLFKSLRSGSISIHREASPFQYWATVVGYAVIVLICTAFLAVLIANWVFGVGL